jgi:DNA-binding transcriptional LysR family regulator
MDVNFELYKVFHTVAKTGSFSAAARELFISQSAVSQSIKNLEECTGSLLFARGPRRVKLTAVGEMLYSHVEQACNLLNKAEAKIREMQSLDLGEVKIGVGDTILRYLLIPFLQKFIRDYPNIKLKIINRTSLGIINSIRTGAVDLGIVTMPISDSDIDAAVLCEVEDVFIASSRFSSLENRPVSLEELAAYPLMLLQKESSTRKNLDSFFISKGIEITPEIELESMDLLVELARIGLGIAYVLKECAIQFVEKKELFMLQLKEPSPKRQLAIASLKNVPLSPAAQAFREKLREYGHGLAGDSSQV